MLWNSVSQTSKNETDYLDSSFSHEGPTIGGSALVHCTTHYQIQIQIQIVSAQCDSPVRLTAFLVKLLRLLAPSPHFSPGFCLLQHHWHRKYTAFALPARGTAFSSRLFSSRSPPWCSFSCWQRCCPCQRMQRLPPPPGSLLSATPWHLPSPQQRPRWPTIPPPSCAPAVA